MIEQALWRSMEQFAPAYINTALYPEDPKFLLPLGHHESADIALSQYYSTAIQHLRTACQLMTWKFGAVANVGAFLDASSDFGQMVRLLVLSLPASRIWVADTQANSIAFQQDQYHVHGIPSTSMPEEFDPGRSFDCIFATSLSSHLPDELFRRWLARLGSLLAPDGILCIGAQDGVFIDPSQGAPGSGGYSYIHLKRVLGYRQDMYVIGNISPEEFSRLQFEYGPWGWIDGAEIVAPGRIHVIGWAATVDDGQCIAAIEVCLNGEVVQICMPSIRRDDVQSHFGEFSFGVSFFDGDSLVNIDYDATAFATCGWECSFLYDVSSPKQFLEVTAVTSHGARCPLYLGRVEAVLR